MENKHFLSSFIYTKSWSEIAYNGKSVGEVRISKNCKFKNDQTSRCFLNEVNLQKNTELKSSGGKSCGSFQFRP